MKLSVIYAVLFSICSLSSIATVTNESLRSPQNQVFQFCYEDTLTYESNNKVNTAAYLWIPENCIRLKGLLVLCRNVTEHTLVGHPAIREICRKNNLGILWCVPSFFSTSNKDPSKSVEFLQKILDDLANQSGYSEVATVPWLPIGESGHLLMVDHLLDGAPDRCIAGIYVKNAHYFCKNRSTPILVAVGTAQEWDQDKIDIRKNWREFSFYGSILKEHKAYPTWPISLVIDGGSGHFDCPEWMVEYLAEYIDTAARNRLSKDSDQLLPINYNLGYVTGLPVPKGNPIAVHQFKSTPKTNSELPWFFTKSLAEKSYAAAAINWNAATQLPAFADSLGKPALMLFRGVTNPVPIQFEHDGVTFSISSTFLKQIPKNFLHAGEKLAVPESEAVPEWICGPIIPIGNNKFQISLDRTWKNSPVCVALRNIGTDNIRAIAEPGYINLEPNTKGIIQHISFNKLPGFVSQKQSIILRATTDSNMPVSFFVVSGPAIINKNELIFTSIPPRTRYPVKVTVSAWQWGRSDEPKIQTANIVTQSFYITSDKKILP